MHKFERSCFFGEERVRLKEGFPLKLGEKEKKVWESDMTIIDSTLHLKPIIHIEVFYQTGKLQWTEIKEMLRNGKEIKTRFDGSCNLIKDESLSNDSDYLRLAEQHRKQIPPFLEDADNTQNLSASPKDTFQHHAMKTGGQHKQNEQRETFYIPDELARKIGLNGRRQILWTGSEGYPAFEFTEKARHTSSISRDKLTIKHSIAKVFGMEKGMIIQFLANDDGSVTLKKANERLPNAAVIQEHVLRRPGRKTQLIMDMRVPPEIQELGFGDKQVEWIRNEGEIVIKPADNLYLGSVVEVIIGGKTKRFQVHIPKYLPEAKNLGVNTKVGFIINEKEQVVLVPKKSELPAEDIKQA